MPYATLRRIQNPVRREPVLRTMKTGVAVKMLQNTSTSSSKPDRVS